jgi:outer membrane protein
MSRYLKRLLIVALVAITASVQAQKFGYVDSKYILSHIPEYQAAQAEINKLSTKWQQEIEAKYDAIERLEKAYQAEKILLTDDMRKARESEMETKRQEAKDMQKKKFGVEGELFKKREDLIKPIQDKIYEAIVEVASTGALMAVFDKANHSNLLYTNPKHDISDKVLKKMGYKPGDVIEGEGEGGKNETEEEEKEQPSQDKQEAPKGGARSGGKK